jgi:hypothetical protein
LGLQCGQQSSQPATAASGFDRNEARNPQLHIVPSVMQHNKNAMKQTFALFLTLNFILTGYGQDFQFIKPTLTDSTKVVKTEIDTKNRFERIYFIDYSKKSQAKNELANFGFDSQNPSETIGLTYSGILKNLKTRPSKINSNLPEKWVKLFKYNGEWVLFNDLPKNILTDSCLITFDMDDPVSSVITDYRFVNASYIFSLLSYNWENPNDNLKSQIEIKVLDSKRMITLWKCVFRDQESYELRIPVNQISNFPIMVMLETDLMDDEKDIFDKFDYEKLWKQ